MKPHVSLCVSKRQYYRAVVNEYACWYTLIIMNKDGGHYLVPVKAMLLLVQVMNYTQDKFSVCVKFNKVHFRSNYSTVAATIQVWEGNFMKSKENDQNENGWTTSSSTKHDNASYNVISIAYRSPSVMRFFPAAGAPTGNPICCCGEKSVYKKTNAHGSDCWKGV